MRLAAAVAVLAAMLALAGSGGAGVPAPPTPGDVMPTWSPDGSVIVFLSTRDGSALRVVNPDGTGERQIPWLASDATFSFSPDWSHVAFQDERRDVIVERLDGSGRVDLGRGVYANRPSWSPDGTRLTYEVQPDAPNFPYVVVARIDGSEVERLVRGIEPQWSPTGDRIAYLTGEPGDLQLHVMRLDGSGDTQPSRATGFLEPRWSPDGTRIAAELGQALVIVDVAAGGTIRVLRSRTGYGDYAWSPRGDTLAFSTPAGIRIFEPATGRVKAVSSFGDEPAWSPDGRQLAFSGGGECRDRSAIYRIVDVRGPAPQRITNDCRIVGTEGNDVLRGTTLADVLVGLGGNDVLTAVPQYYSGDTLEGGQGDDVLLGSYQSDTLDGGPGNDILQGGPGSDLLVGGPGRDTIQGEGGRDLIYARDGEADTISCGTNAGTTTGQEGDVAYVDAIDKVSSDCEYVYRPGPARPVRGLIQLTITVWPEGNLGPKSPKHVYELRCRPAGGTLPYAVAACARLQHIQNPFAPIPPAMVCTLVFAGPENAAVGGVYGGRPVRTGFNRQSSCQIARWDRLRFLFPLP
jgi:Tol biopolymer transport system component